jgi:hypothetical protein
MKTGTTGKDMPEIRNDVINKFAKDGFRLLQQMVTLAGTS